jgi:hypothetical protein
VSVVPRERQQPSIVHSWSWSCSCSAAATHHHANCQARAFISPVPRRPARCPAPPLERAAGRRSHKRTLTNQASGQGERHREWHGIGIGMHRKRRLSAPCPIGLRCRRRRQSRASSFLSGSKVEAPFEPTATVNLISTVHSLFFSSILNSTI